ncbi:MAG: MFS transporter [Bacillales bacterium]|nr:MFS transporter [Bacillales bacterium]
MDSEASVSSLKQTKRPYVLAAVMLAMFMGAIESTIVSTAMPDIVSDLGGFSLYGWVFSAYLLMNSVTVLIYGKLSDLLGRKPIISIGIILFLIGSTLCGFAQSMGQLILYRFIQGIGAGAVMPIANTIIGDIYTKDERAKVQGYLSSVWGISAIVGPAVGGILVEYVSWHFVFWMNIPLGLLSLLGIWLFFHEHLEKKNADIDYLGALFFTIAISSFMFLLVEGGVYIPWRSNASVGMLIGVVLFFGLFIWQEKRAKEPLVPFAIWTVPSITIANVVSFITGVMLIGISSFLPTYVQGVMGENATIAGFTLTAMSIGWPIASTVSGRLLLKIGYRNTSLVGGIFLVIGGLFFVFMKSSSGPLWAAVSSFFVGVGMGLTSTAFIVSIQSTVEWKQRGIATATNMFMRNLGNTVGAALLGGVLNSRLQHYLENRTDSHHVSINSINSLLGNSGNSGIPSSLASILRNGLSDSLHTVFLVVFFCGLLSFVLVMFLPKNE